MDGLFLGVIWSWPTFLKRNFVPADALTHETWNALLFHDVAIILISFTYLTNSLMLQTLGLESSKGSFSNFSEIEIESWIRLIHFWRFEWSFIQHQFVEHFVRCTLISYLTNNSRQFLYSQSYFVQPPLKERKILRIQKRAIKKPTNETNNLQFRKTRVYTAAEVSSVQTKQQTATITVPHGAASRSTKTRKVSSAYGRSSDGNFVPGIRHYYATYSPA